MKKLIIALLFLSTKSAVCKQYLIHSEKEFITITKQFKPGDVISIANGTYATWALNIATNGTASQPITIQAETTGKVIFSGDTNQAIFKLTGSYTVLRGITFIGCGMLKTDNEMGGLVELANSNYCRMTECVFTKNIAKAQFMPIVVVSGSGMHNQIDHCTFSENIDNQEVKVKITNDSCPQYTLIEHNLFIDKDKLTWKILNGGECIQIGQDPVLLGKLQAFTTVRYNRFLRCKGEAEVISNKSSNNTYLKNYFENCEGELVMRGGYNCLVDSNTIKGGNSGIRVNGKGHIITNNNISNVKVAIRLMYGMENESGIGFYLAASDCFIKNNHIENATTGILIGGSKNVDWTGKFDTSRYPSRVIQDVAPYNNTFSNNVFNKVDTQVTNNN